MRCLQCGNELDANATFCVQCGAPAPEDMPIEAPAAAPSYTDYTQTGDLTDYDTSAYRANKSGNNSTLVKIVILMGALILALVVVLVIILMVKKAPAAVFQNEPARQNQASQYQPQQEEGLSPDNLYYDVFLSFADYVLPGSNNTYKCYTDISALTDTELTVAEQEIAARHGVTFTDPELQAYFEARDWYVPSGRGYTPNYHEQANLDLIRIYRAKQDGSLYYSGNGYINAFSRNTQYAISGSDYRLLNGADLYALSEEQLCVARNEILARHGWIFSDPELREYFYSKDWYRPSVPGANFDYGVLSSTESSNISLIEVYEGIAEGNLSWSANNPYKTVYYNWNSAGRGWIFSDSSSRYLNYGDLFGMTEDELCIARNEIFARNGYTFKSSNLMEYFLHCNWYRPQTAPGDSSSIYFSVVENANIDLLHEAEKFAAGRSDKTFYPDMNYEPGIY